MDFGGIEVTHIDWIDPLPNETIENYAKRLSAFITTPNPILVGLSFGGMMAVEIGKIIPTQKIILISSAKNYKELPFYLRLLGKTGLQNILSASWFLTPNPFVFWFFGLKEKEHKQLFAQVLRDTDPKLYKWSGNAILTWKNKTLLPNIIHIHGAYDTVLPYRFVKVDYTIKARHFAVITHPKEVSDLLKKIISE